MGGMLSHVGRATEQVTLWFGDSGTAFTFTFNRHLGKTPNHRGSLWYRVAMG